MRPLVAALALGAALLAAGCDDAEGGATSASAPAETAPAAVTVPAPEPQADWAPAEAATIRPGVQMRTEGAQCTANFVFVAEDADAPDGLAMFLGQAAHCSTLGTAFDLNGCETDSRPLGTEVRIDGARRPGRLVYNSWRAMAEREESDLDACRFNDFALVRIDPADHDRVNPTVPVFGGPTGVNAGGVPTERPVHSFGNSLIRLGIEALNLNQGISVGRRAEGWSHRVVTLTPGIPGDSGSAFLDDQGRALGILSTAGGLGTSDLTDIGKALDYARTTGDLAAEVATGTEPFSSTGGAPPLADPPGG